MFLKFNFTAKYIWGKIKQNIFISHRALVHMVRCLYPTAQGITKIHLVFVPFMSSLLLLHNASIYPPWYSEWSLMSYMVRFFLLVFHPEVSRRSSLTIMGLDFTVLASDFVFNIFCLEGPPFCDIFDSSLIEQATAFAIRFVVHPLCLAQLLFWTVELW